MRRPLRGFASYPAARPAGLVCSPPWWLLATPAILVWFYLFIGFFHTESWIAGANLAGPLALGVAAAAAAYQLARSQPEVLWAPYPWFLLAVVLFYSVGPLLYPLAGPKTVAFASMLVSLDPTELLRTNLLDAVGVLAVLIGVAGGAQLWKPRPIVKVVRQPVARARTVALVFLVVGGAIEYLVVLPYTFGIYEVVLPGVVMDLGDVYLLGLMMLAYVVARGEKAWRLPLLLLWAVQIGVALLMFVKRELLLAILLPPLGAYLGHRRMARLAFWGVIAALVYFSSAQFVLWGRQQIYMRTGSINEASLSARIQIVGRWLEKGMPRLNQQISSAGTGWNRLNYAPDQAIAMRRYDNGYSGDTLRYAPIIFIPRFIWPQKPVTTDLGVDFYELLTGRRGTHEGIGIFGEGYWDYGWLGVMTFGLAAGVVFSMLGNFSVGWVRRRQFEYLPSIFLGINMGIVGTTGYFVNYVIGPAGFFFVYALAAYAVVLLVSAVRGAVAAPRLFAGRRPT